MNNKFVHLEYLSPTGFIGFWILFIGLIFTGIIFYFVFFRINTDDKSYNYKEKKVLIKRIKKKE